jgi:surface antigen
MIAIAALCAGLNEPAHATTTASKAVVNAMPATKFSSQDHALMMERVDQALKADKDGQTLEWKNEKSPASGSVTPLARLEWQGLQCRRLRIHNAYGEIKAQGVYKFCEKPAGRWKLVGPDQEPG